MSNNAEPSVGNWYQYPEDGESFEVLEVDEDRGVVEIQYADGERDEIDLEEWGDLEVDLTDPPEDWAETIERGEAARRTASKDPDDPAASDPSRRSRHSSDDAGEDDEDDDEPNDYPVDESWRDDA
ncbi:MAG: DUF6763 family protein [Gammaproteobacteria bacterium]